MWHGNFHDIHVTVTSDLAASRAGICCRTTHQPRLVGPPVRTRRVKQRCQFDSQTSRLRGRPHGLDETSLCKFLRDGTVRNPRWNPIAVPLPTPRQVRRRSLRTNCRWRTFRIQASRKLITSCCHPLWTEPSRLDREVYVTGGLFTRPPAPTGALTSGWACCPCTLR